MSEQQHSGFGQFIPGFDFLQNLAKGTAQGMPQMPNLSSWVAPTLNVQELDKRIGELKAVRFWLEQNAAAVGATVQALEVQKMTLAALQGMNFDLADLAESLKVTPPPAAAPASAGPGKVGARDAGAGDAAKAVDPLQWWGALTQQFQQIAAKAMHDVAASADAAKAATASAAPPAADPPAAARRKRPARKTAGG